jgi:hypothetical protein
VNQHSKARRYDSPTALEVHDCALDEPHWTISTARRTNTSRRRTHVPSAGRTPSETADHLVVEALVTTGDGDVQVGCVVPPKQSADLS